MKIFPHILSRVGGITIKEIQSFSLGEYHLVNKLLENDVEILKTKMEISNEFQKIIEKLTSPYLKTKMINAFRDFKKGRKRFEKVARDTGIHGSLKLVHLLSDLAHFEKSKNSIYQNLEKVYEERFILSVKRLQILSKEDNFQKGVLQSSQSFYHQIRSFQLSNTTTLNKKLRQTSRSLAQYIYRAATKTSPFSHFTTLDLMSLEGGLFQSEKKGERNSFLQYNNFLLLELKEMLLKDLSFCENMILQLNPSIIQNETEFCFIKNDRNIESFQQLEKSDFLELIYNKINTEALVFNILIKDIQNDVDAETDDLIDYLMNLVENGFLEFQWDFRREENWETKFPFWLFSIKEYKITNPWQDLFNSLSSKKNEYKNTSSENRLYLQNNLKHDIELGGFSETKPEIILFEDVLTPRGFSLKEEDIKPIVRTLDGLLFLVEPLMEDVMKLKIQYLHEKHFKNTAEVSLVKFYEIFFQEDFEKIDTQNNYNEFLTERWNETITQTGKMLSEGTLHFSLDEIRKKIPPRKVPTYKYSGLFQFYKEEGKTKAVINGLSPGYGKLFGRFLHMFPDDVTKDLQEWNRPVNGAYFVAENKDASYYNVNLHPPLVDYEIKMNNSQNQLPSQNQIPVSEIVIRRSDSGRGFSLYSSKTQKFIDITDLGFENPKARSPMFQLINGFRLTHGTYRIFLKMVNKIYVQENEEGVRFYPRVVIDDHLVLQRKAQVMDVSFFPKIIKNESRAAFFFQIQKFKNFHNLPQYVFVQPIRDFSNPESFLKQDFYKPQFIDLHAPISIEILKSIIQKHQGKIKIEEMLPMPEVLETDYVREDVVEWN